MVVKSVSKASERRLGCIIKCQPQPKPDLRAATNQKRAFPFLIGCSSPVSVRADVVKYEHSFINMKNKLMAS